VSDAETPAWRYVVPGLLFIGFAGYLLVTGEMPVDKQRSIVLSRSGNPLFYWLTVLVSGSIGALALRKVWRRLRS
jgi:hypothetical protein